MTEATRKSRSTKPKPARARDAHATRAAILASARVAFATHGYDGAGVREIAAGAGVTAMLVNRYFGSKEKLFAEVSRATMAEPIILSDANLKGVERAAHMTRALVAITTPGETPLEGFQIMLRSAASQTAAKIGREEIDARYQKLLAGSLEGPHPEERAALLFALVAGVQFMRQTMELTALAKAKPATLTSLLLPFVEALVGR